MSRLAPRDLRLGRLHLHTIDDAVTRRVGNVSEAVGAAVVPSEPRPRTMKLSVPLHGDRGDALARETGFRLRRQLEAILENEDYRQLLYLEFSVDPDLDGWIVLSGGELAYVGDGGAGPTFGDFRFEPEETYRVGDSSSAREARRIAFIDRRLSTTPRDYYLERYDALSAALATRSLVFLPIGATNIVGRDRREVSTIDTTSAITGAAARRTIEGAETIAYQAVSGEVLHFEREPRHHGRGDVVAHHRGELVAPAAELEDRFSAGTAAFQAAYARAPAASAANLDVAGGVRASAGTGVGYSIQRPFDYTDGVYVSADLLVGGTLAAFQAYVQIGTEQAAADGAATGLRVGIMDDGAASELRLMWLTPTGTARTHFKALPARLATGTRYWLGVSFIANTVYAAVYATADMSTPPIATLSVDLEREAETSADWAGVLETLEGHTRRAGLYWVPQSTAARVQALRMAPLGDVQPVTGWEELYGPGQHGPWELPFALTTNDVGPMLSNGLVRVRPINHRQQAGTSFGPLGSLQFALAIDTYVDGVGWREHGRVAPVGPATSAPFVSALALQRAELVEWTPERAVARFTLVGGPGGGCNGSELIVTLGRGDLGPRFELYVVPDSAGVAQLAELRFAPYDEGAHFAAAATSAGAVLRASDDPGVTWDALLTAVASDASPWLYLQPVTNRSADAQVGGIFPDGIATALATLRQAGTEWWTVDDSTLGPGAATRKAAAVRNPAGTAAAGYASLIVAPVHRGAIVEAETYRTAQTQVADAAASGGQAVESTLTASATFIDVPAGAIPARGALYGLFVRIRAVDAASTAAARVVLGAGAIGTGPTNSVTSQAFTWVYLGEMSGADATRIQATVVRSAGTGNTRIDRIATVPLERNATLSAAANGNDYRAARDVAAAHLIERRLTPDLVDR